MSESNAFQIFGLSWKLYFSQYFKKNYETPPNLPYKVPLTSEVWEFVALVIIRVERLFEITRLAQTPGP
jgi:hypothetical protein